jgi:hypothetical protein
VHKTASEFYQENNLRLNYYIPFQKKNTNVPTATFRHSLRYESGTGKSRLNYTRLYNFFAVNCVIRKHYFCLLGKRFVSCVLQKLWTKIPLCTQENLLGREDTIWLSRKPTMSRSAMSPPSESTLEAT